MASQSSQSSPGSILVLAMLAGTPGLGLAQQPATLDAHGNPAATYPARPVVSVARGPIPTNVPVFGLDARNGFDASSILATGSRFDSFRGFIASQGFAVVALTSFESADLASLDGLILNMRYQVTPPYSPSEIAAIQQLVAHGGGLLAIADGGSGSDVINFNQVVAPFGGAFSFFETDPSGHAVSAFVSHPVTAGLTTVGVDYQRALTSILPPSVDLTIGTGSDDILAVADGVSGTGNVALISDGSLWSDDGEGADTPIGFGDNRRLLGNILSYLAANSCEPAFTVSLAPGSLWPPNHSMADIEATIVVTEACDPFATVKLRSVTSSEPDEGTGDGDFPDDIQEAQIGTEDARFQLRSERSGSGSGRLYIACYELSDPSGNSLVACDSVLVPHNRGGRADLIAEAGGVTLTIFGDSYAPVRQVLPSSVEVGSDDFVRFSPDVLQAGYEDRNGDGIEDAFFQFATAADELGSVMRSGVPLFAHWSDGQSGFLASLNQGSVLDVPGDDLLASMAVSVVPNPARGRVTMRYMLPAPGRVRLRVFDIAGRELSRVVDGEMPAGRHEAKWSASGTVTAQVYLYRLEALGRTISGQFALLRSTGR